MGGAEGFLLSLSERGPSGAQRFWISACSSQVSLIRFRVAPSTSVRGMAQSHLILSWSAKKITRVSGMTTAIGMRTLISDYIRMPSLSARQTWTNLITSQTKLTNWVSGAPEPKSSKILTMLTMNGEEEKKSGLRPTESRGIAYLSVALTTPWKRATFDAISRSMELLEMCSSWEILTQEPAEASGSSLSQTKK